MRSPRQLDMATVPKDPIVHTAKALPQPTQLDRRFECVCKHNVVPFEHNPSRPCRYPMYACRVRRIVFNRDTTASNIGILTAHWKSRVPGFYACFTATDVFMSASISSLGSYLVFKLSVLPNVFDVSRPTPRNKRVREKYVNMDPCV